MLSTLRLIALAVAMGAAGQTFLKVSVDGVDFASIIGRGPMAVLEFALRSPLLLAGFLMYGIGALAWIIVLSRVDLSFAYPFLALNFLVIALISRFMLGESIPPIRWLGVGVVCAGILLIARSSN
jgi:drug/metabolite transporter (DMT)-like permease